MQYTELETRHLGRLYYGLEDRTPNRRTLVDSGLDAWKPTLRSRRTRAPCDLCVDPGRSGLRCTSQSMSDVVISRPMTIERAWPATTDDPVARVWKAPAIELVCRVAQRLRDARGTSFSQSDAGSKCTSSVLLASRCEELGSSHLRDIVPRVISHSHQALLGFLC
jgi:hypothetical protein